MGAPQPPREHDHARWHHRHEFDRGNPAAERSTRLVVWITAVAMVAEIAAGWWFNSMALLADGWHMGSHALAIGLSVLAYAAARRYAADPRFAFGTWKIEILGSFASAVLLGGVALLMIVGSIERLLDPQPIRYLEALLVAVLGLLVNLVCAGLLGGHGHHDHGHGHGNEHGGHGHDHGGNHDHDHDRQQHAHHGHAHHEHDLDDHGLAQDHGRERADRHDDARTSEDLNLRAAYVHVLTDAATSLLAIVALLGGWLYGWAFLDPLMGIAGALLIAVWAKKLIVQSATVLLDREMDHPVVDAIRDIVEAHDPAAGNRVIDLHVWRVGRRAFACAMSVVTHDPALTAGSVRSLLESRLPDVAHVTVEIHYCDE